MWIHPYLAWQEVEPFPIIDHTVVHYPCSNLKFMDAWRPLEHFGSTTHNSRSILVKSDIGIDLQLKDYKYTTAEIFPHPQIGAMHISFDDRTDIGRLAAGIDFWLHGRQKLESFNTEAILLMHGFTLNEDKGLHFRVQMKDPNLVRANSFFAMNSKFCVRAVRSKHLETAPRCVCVNLMPRGVKVTPYPYRESNAAPLMQLAAHVHQSPQFCETIF